jgi:hypothetical protein
MSTERPPRVLRNGLLRPWAVDYFNGLDEARRLSEELGAEIAPTPEQAHALGVATAEQAEGEGVAQVHDPDPELSDEASQALDQIVADRAAAS